MARLPGVAARGLSSRRLLSHFGVPRWKLPGIARHMRRLAARDAGAIRLFDGVPEMLKSLSEHGVTLAIASSNTEATIRAVLGPRNAALISHYACGASLFGKRAKYRIIRKASGLQHAEILCIGDEVRDLEAARAEGLAFGAVSWGYASIEALEALQPEEVFASLDEIVPRVTSPADAAAASA